MSADTDSTRSAAADAAAAPLDMLLGDAATGMLRRMNPGGSGLRLAAALVSRPQLVAGRGRQLLGELGRIAVGSSQVQPSRRDRRFADPAWAGNPLLRRLIRVPEELAHVVRLPVRTVLRTWRTGPRAADPPDEP